MNLRVGVLGTGFGQAHIDALRAAGVEPEVVWSRTAAAAERVAAAKGVARATTDLADLATMDVITIATPTSTHLDLIRRFPRAAIICEKPLHGRPVDPSLLASCAAGRHVLVHYSFPFLDSARAVEAVLRSGRLGAVRRVVCSVRVRFDRMPDTPTACREMASHELAWLIHLFGPMAHLSHACGSPVPSARISLDAGGVPIELLVIRGARTGILMDVTMHGDQGWLRLHGGWDADHDGWSFAPLEIDGRSEGSGEDSSAGCIWFRSNCRWFAGAFTLLAGRSDPEQASALGIWSITDAARVESALGAACG